MKNKRFKKAISLVLSVLMLMSCWVWVAPTDASAASTYYVRVYLNIYDGANSDGYGKPYTVVTDPSSEFYGKPNDYKWDYGSSWSATDNSDGYDGEINMAGFTLFYDNDKKYETYDLSADLVAATTTLGNNFTSMDNLTLQNFSQAQYKVEKIYAFELDSMPSSLFWVNDENNAVNGETGFGIHKITVAESSTSQEHILWSGLSGSESYYECYYGTITPTGLITPWDDCPDAQTYTFYKDYTTSAIGTWIDPFNAGDYNVYPVNNYLSGGVSASFTVGNSGSQTNIDFVDVGNTNNYYINFTNHSTQDATITLFKADNKSLLSGYYDNYPIPSGKTVSFALNKGSMGGDGNYVDFSFWFKLNNVYNSDGTTQTNFYQAAGIGTWNTTDDLKAIGLPAGESANAGFTLKATDIDVMNRFMVDKGILESSYLSGNRTTPITFTYNYWLDNSEGMTNWSQTGLRMYAQKWGNYRLHFQPDAQGTMAIEGAIANSNASLSIADLVTSYTSASDTFTYPDSSNRPWAYVGSSCKPQWDGTTSLQWGTLWDSGDSGYFRFCGNLFQGSTTTSDPAKITFSNMTWVCPALWSGGSSSSASFSGTINVYVFDKTDLRNYVRNLGGLGANWAPMRTRFNDAQWNAYEIALKTAKEVLANQKTNQKAVTDAYNALYSATEALKATSSLKSQVAEVTYTQRTTDYDSAVVSGKKLSKYIIMPIGTETAVPSYDAYKHTTSGDVVAKQSSNLKTNYTQYDTGINPIDYRYWKIDFTGVDEAIARADDIINKHPQTYPARFVEDIEAAKETLAILDREADTYSPSHQSDISDAFAVLDALLAHDSTEPGVHNFYDDVRHNENNHWYECEICGYQLMYDHNFTYSYNEGEAVHTVTCTDSDTQLGCGYSYEEAHSGEWTQTKAPSYTEEGEQTRTCKCGCVETASIPMLEDTNAPVITTSGSTDDDETFCKGVSVTVTDETTFTLTVTKDGEEYTVNDTSAFSLTEVGTYIITATDSKGTVSTKTITVNADHTIDTWTKVDDLTHKGTCTVCGEEVTASHIFTNPVLTRPIKNADGTWTDGTYTYTCICGAIKEETAERADYSELEEAVADLEELKKDENLTDDAKAEIDEALKKAEELADDLVTVEQGKIDELVKELQDVKTDVEEIINEQIGVDHITEATSGIKVKFLKKTGVDTVDYVQLGANGGFDTVRMRLTNGNADLPITVTSVVADKAYIGATDAAASGTYNTATSIEVGGSKDLYIVAPANFAEAGIVTYTITYTIDGLMDADGNPVEFTTKAYLYVKAAGYNPHHYMDEKVGVGSETSEWDFYLEATNYGDFELVYDNKAPYDAFENDNLVQDGVGLFDYVREQYDYENDACYAGCANGSYDDGDAHAATYRYYIDTSLAPTYEAAGLRARFVENEAGYYHNAPLKYVRLANNQTYLDKISGNDKTFSVTFLPSSSGTQGMTWTATSNGDMTVSQYDNPDQNNLLFGYHHPNEGCEETTAYANFAGAIPTGTEDAKLMFSPRLEFNGPNIGFAEAVTMTTHLYITSYDKAELREAVANAETAGYNNKYYADKQYEAYENALKNAKEVLGKAETNQNEVDEATRQLEAAIENLVKAENEARFVLTVTHSIHDGADRNSENPDVSNKDYYLIATNESVEAALLSAEVLEGYTVNKHDKIAVFAIEDGKDTEKEYHYWYIDYSDVQDAIDAADEIIKNKDDYNEDFINDVTEKKEALEDILEGKDDTTTPESQGTVDDAIKDVTELTGHTHNEDVIIPAQAPSCTVGGLTEGAKCSECGMITKAQTTVNASGHTFITIAAKAATCLAPGNVEYKQCTVCNLFFAADAEVTAENGVGSTASFVLKQLDHSYTGEYQWNNAGETKYHSQKCVNGCGEYGPEEACDFESVETNAPTCTVGGTITHTCKVCNNSYITYTSANGHSWSNWELKTAPTAETDGTYIRTCQVCNTTEEKSVKREDYSAYDEAVKKAEDLLNDEKLTPEAKEVIQNALDEANKLDQKLPADVVEDGKTIIDNANDEIINAAADALNNALDSLYDENGKLKDEFKKIDYTKYDNAVEAYENLKDTMTDADKAAVEAIKKPIDAIPENGTAAQYQTQVDKAATDIAAINAKYGNCATGNHTWGEPVLTTAPTADSQGEYTETCTVCGATQITKVDLANYGDFNTVVGQLENLLGTENLTDDAKKDIEDALEKAEELDKNLPADVTTVDGKEIKGGQDTIDALVTELNGVVADTNADIADGSALKPDYANWEIAEGNYDALDKTNVKADIIAEANGLKDTIAGKQADETLTQATATQTDINNATTRLNQIIEGITDGSLRDPDYSAVEDKIDEAKGNDNLNKDTQDKIEEIEKALEEIKGRTEPEANYRDNQDEVNALEDQLDEILKDIENGTATAPDYTEWNNAEGTYTAIDKTNVPDELVTEAANLKATIDALKADDTANAKDDQQTINDATTRLNEIITEINGILTEKPDYSGYDTSHDAYEKLVEQYGDKIKDGVADDVTALDTIVDGVRNDETSTKVDDQGTVDNAKTALDAIIDGIKDGSLRDPDYSAVEDKIEDAKDATGLNKDTQDKIDAIEKALEEIKNKEPEANAKVDQPVVDALEDQLDEILEDIENGTATAPDYTEWDNAEGEYTGLDKTDVKDDILEEAEELKKVIDALKNDPTANATEDQKTVTDAADRLNDIIDGINDGSLRDPDYSAVEDKIDEAKDNGNLNKDTQDKIEAIEKALDEIKNKEPEANAKDDQPAVDALEDQLDEILEDIENGTAIKPDYSEAEKAIQDAESIDGISDADKAIVDGLKKQLEDIKNNPESNKTEHQDDVDDIRDAALELVEKYESMCFHEGTEKKYTTNVADDKKQSTHTVQCLRCGEVIGTENCSFRTEIVAATCRSEGYTIYTCEGCKLSFKDDFTDPAAHNYSEWRVKEGSCKTANTKTRYCLNPGCMAEQTETVIGADGKPVYGAHTFVIVKGSEATCLNDGYTDYSRCIVCNEVTESKVIPAKGHVDNNHNGNCDVCSQLVNPSGHCSCFCHGDSFFEKLLFRIVNFFWKLFKINPICGCGTKHW